MMIIGKTICASSGCVNLHGLIVIRFGYGRHMWDIRAINLTPEVLRVCSPPCSHSPPPEVLETIVLIPSLATDLPRYHLPHRHRPRQTLHLPPLPPPLRPRQDLQVLRLLRSRHSINMLYRAPRSPNCHRGRMRQYHRLDHPPLSE